MIALVRGVIARSAATGSRFNVAGSTSANTGLAPQCHTALAVAMNDSEGTTTSWPGPTPNAWRARCSAVVQLVVATASRAPTRAANASSNARTRGPWEIQPEAIAAPTAARDDPQSRTALSTLHPPPVDQRSQPGLQSDPCLEPEPLAGKVRVGEPAGHLVDVAFGAKLGAERGVHHRQKCLGQFGEARLHAAGDVEHLVGHVRGGRENVGPRDIRNVHEVHRVRPVAVDQWRQPLGNALHPTDEHLRV